MKSNKITIQIKAPIEDVFEFTTNPVNTPKWIDSVIIEETSEWPIKKGAIYKNLDIDGNQNKYEVSNVIDNKLFELISEDGNYHVRYTYLELSKNLTELEYFEWVDNDDLENPFSADVLEKLKKEIEFESK